MLSYHLPLVDILTRGDEEAPAILQVVECVGKGVAGLQRDDGAIGATGDIPLPWLKGEEAVRDDSLTARERERSVIESKDCLLYTSDAADE